MTDLRYAFRQSLKSPSLSATAVLALALGIGATTAMFAVVYAFLLRPLPFAAPQDLVMLESRHTRSGNDLGVNFLDFRDWQTQSRSFVDSAFFNLRWNGNLEAPDGSTETLQTTFTTANLFQLLGVEPVAGRKLLPADDEPEAARVVVISHRLWQRMFGGSPGVIGRPLRLDGTLRTVIAVMPPGFRFPSQSDLWVPMASVFGRSADRSWRADQVIARLRPQVSLGEARAEMNLLAQRLAQAHPETNKEIGAAVVPLREHWTGGVRFSLLLLLAGCGGVLLIACANVSQILLARAITREREFAVRAALGASRWRLARQALTESALLAVCGTVAGTLLAFWLVDLVAASIRVELPYWIQFEVNGGVLAFTVAVSFVTALLAGSVPAWQAARLGLAGALKSSSAGNSGGTSGGTRARSVLTIVQVAVSVVLLVSASLVLRSLLKLEAVDPGFDPRQVLLMEVNPTYNADESAATRVDRFSRLLERLRALPGVELTAANNSPPFIAQRPWNRTQLLGEGQPEEAERLNPTANFQTVSADYFATLRIPLRRGRHFTGQDNLDAPRVCIVSERLAQALWPGEDAVGKRLKPTAGSGDEWLTVVGVVGDVRHQALEGAAGPDLYKPSTQLAWKQMHFLLRARPGIAPLSLAPAVRRAIAESAPEVGVFHFVALEKEVADSLWQQRLRGWLLGFFSSVALLLAAAGLYGVVAYGVAQRTREIGIRIALGATRTAVVKLVLLQCLRAVGLGLGLGLAGAFMLARVLNASLFGVNNHDFMSYVGASVLLGGTAALASFLPARRASRVNPVEALRAE